MIKLKKWIKNKIFLSFLAAFILSMSQDFDLAFFIISFLVYYFILWTLNK